MEKNPIHPLTPLEFEELMAPYGHVPRLAVGVSGGADSMVLSFLLKQWALKKKAEVFALTVDHKLRTESTEECKQVWAWMVKMGIPCTVLTWDHGGIKSRIQERARNARFDLLTAWCRNNQVEHLALAHHGGDQWETFMMRLAKGSGLKGLCAMAPEIKNTMGSIIRPLLGVDPQRILKTAEVNNIAFTNDPSNGNLKFARVRLRQLRLILEKEGLDIEAISKVITDLKDADDFIENQVEAAIEECFEGGLLNLELFKNLEPLIALRLLSRLIRHAGENIYPLNRNTLGDIYNKIISCRAGQKFTAGHCLMTATKEKKTLQVSFEREVRNLS